MPIGKIPIKKSSYLKIENAQICLLGANPEHHVKIKTKMKNFKKKGGIFCSIFPNTTDYLEDVLK